MNPELLPIGFMLDEGKIAERQQNAILQTQAILTQAAVASILSKDGQKLFNKLIEGLNNG